MKKLFLFLSIVMTMTAAMGQEVEKDAISEAIKSGDPQKIAVYFMPSVDLTVETAEGVYSKDQAEMIIRRFFEDHIPKGFALKHQGKSKLDDYYYIGTLTTQKGEYRLTFFLKKSEESFRIKQMRIENTP
jgi:hypothetical protein